LCIYVDDGIMVLNSEGKLLGKIDNHASGLIHYVSIDGNDTNYEDDLDEIILKDKVNSLTKSSRIRILKYCNGDYRVVFEKIFKESYLEKSICHPILEQIIPMAHEDCTFIITNDEGELEYYKASDTKKMNYSKFNASKLLSDSE